MAMYLGAAAVWLVVLAKFPAACLGWRDRGRRNYWLTLFFLAVCITADRQLLYVPISEATGINNLAHGLSYAAAVLTGYCGQVMLLNAYDRGRLARETATRRLVLFVGLLAYGLLFLAGPATLPTNPAAPHVAAGGPAEAGFRVVLAVLLCFSLAEVGWLARRLAVTSDHPPLRWGMRAVAAGCAVIGIRILIEYGALPVWSAATGWHAQWTYSGWLYALNVVALWGAALVAVGTALPALARRHQESRTRARQRAACRGLQPLWETMRDVTPTLSRSLPQRAGPLRRPDSRDRLYRMVVEIRDGFVALGPFRDAPFEAHVCARGEAGGRAGVDLAAFVDAGGLAHAIAERAAGAAPASGVTPDTAAAGDSLETEASYLLRVVAHWPGASCAPSTGYRVPLAAQPG